jgi:hypothetical protein
MRSKTGEEIRLLKKLDGLGGGVKFSHQGQYDGRRKTAALIRIDGKYYQGIAVLSRKDFFSRKLGRVIALGRAFRMFEEGRSIVPNEDWAFKDEK